MIMNEIDIKNIKQGVMVTGKLNMLKDTLGGFWQVPVMIAKGKKGPTLGITAALHGNELNGISTIHELWSSVINTDDLEGTIVFIPVLNSPGFLNSQREFHDGRDLNRVMPGKAYGSSSEVYAHAIMNKIVKHLDYLIDLHTASFGRANSLYVKADLSNPIIKEMAILQNPQLIVDNQGPEACLRYQANILGIPAITIEIGDPHIFQQKHINPSIAGLTNVLIELGMIQGEKIRLEHEPIVCHDSDWLYADNAGILEVYPDLVQRVTKDEVIAAISDIYGTVFDEIKAPFDAHVIGKSTNPLCRVGTRVIHLGRN